MKVWRILGRSTFEPPPAHWREALSQRLGQRPRRIGAWAELALFGALACLDDAGETVLPNEAVLSLSSLKGPEAVLFDSLKDLATDLPMPIAFLQSQPGQVLPVLAQHLGWSGNGRCLSTRDPLLALRMACLEAHPQAGVMLGWVDEAGGGKSLWLRAVQTDRDNLPASEMPQDFAGLFQPMSTHFCFDPSAPLRVG